MLNTALRMIRIYHDLTQKELAEKLKISKSYLSEIESGKKIPSLELLRQYSNIFDIPVSSIMFFSESLNKDAKTEQVKTFVSSKILALLNFIAERSGRSYADE